MLELIPFENDLPLTINDIILLLLLLLLLSPWPCHRDMDTIVSVTTSIGNSNGRVVSNRVRFLNPCIHVEDTEIVTETGKCSLLDSGWLEKSC